MDPTNSLSVYKCHPVSEVNSNQFMSVYSIDVRHDSYISSNQCGDCQKCSRISIDKSRHCQRKLCIKSSEKLESRNKGCWTVLRRKFYLISRIIFSRQMQDIEEGDDNKLPQIRYVFLHSYICMSTSFKIACSLFNNYHTKHNLIFCPRPAKIAF